MIDQVLKSFQPPSLKKLLLEDVPLEYIWQEHSVPGDGSCLFHSLAFAMGDTFKSDVLRLTAAQAFLNPQGEYEKELASNSSVIWKSMKLALPDEVPHVPEPALYTVDGVLDESVFRRLVYLSMIKRDLYWGEEFAISITEHRYGITIGVVTSLKPTLPLRKVRLNDCKEKCCILTLKNSHYQPTTVNNTAIFSVQTMPYMWKACFY